MDRLSTFSKPVVVAVNGLGIGIGATVIGHADLVFMSTEARLQCPFTALGVVPEAGSSYLFPRLLNRQDATWVLLSSEWINAEECLRMGLAWRLCAPDVLMDEAMDHARRLAAKPVASLVASKQLLTAPVALAIAEARVREDAMFAELMGGPANAEALRAFAEKRPPDFTGM
jgi:enoyl-CoA hydratase/carnithine racemase